MAATEGGKAGPINPTGAVTGGLPGPGGEAPGAAVDGAAGGGAGGASVCVPPLGLVIVTVLLVLLMTTVLWTFR